MKTTANDSRRIALVVLLLAGALCGGQVHSNEGLRTDCLYESGGNAIESCREYAAINSYRPSVLLQLGARLEDRHKYEEAMAVYDTGLQYLPDNTELFRKKVLSRSEWREMKQLGLVRPGNRETASDSRITARLAAIKCTYLQEKPAGQNCPEKSVPTAMLSSPDAVDNEKAPYISRTGTTHGYETSSRVPHAGLDLGDFHALVIGNNRYRHFVPLETAVADARAVSSLLKEHYGFKVTTLLNTNRYQLLKELSRLRHSLTEKDNLLIYYAGHGYLDERTQRGYWLPVDAERDNYANWLSTNDITDMLNGMSSLRVLVVADSCYSGTLTRGALRLPGRVDNEQLELIKRIAGKRSRTVLTSGGLEPVLDSGSGKHSVFADAFLDALEQNEGFIEAAQMFSVLRRKVILNADQTPEYADIRKAGHQGGDFIFVRQKPS